MIANEVQRRVTQSAIREIEETLARQRPGRVRGLCGIGLRAVDLDQALARIQERGGRVSGGPIEVDDPLHGRARSASAETPEGTFLDVWQPRA